MYLFNLRTKSNNDKILIIKYRKGGRHHDERFY